MNKDLRSLVASMDIESSLFDELLESLPHDSTITELVRKLRNTITETESLAINLNRK